MAGGGKGGGGSRALENLLTEVGGESKPARGELFSQIFESLRTGGIGARLPIVQQAVEQSRQATSGALSGTQAQLSRLNLLGTPYGQNILAQQRQAGEQGTARIPTDIANQFIQMAPGFISSTLGQQFGGASNLAQTSAAREASFMQFLASLYGSSSGMFNFGVTKAL
jgi:hypothetical protein